LSAPLLTAAEVAELFKLNAETVYGLIQKDGLPAAKIGGQWRFSEEKLRAWFEARHVNELGTTGRDEQTEVTVE
jgi:excisionase family DNA binding protein